MCCPGYTRVPDFTLVPVGLGGPVTPQEVLRRVTPWHRQKDCAGPAWLCKNEGPRLTFFDFPAEH
jgi:hypothetical protein